MLELSIKVVDTCKFGVMTPPYKFGKLEKGGFFPIRLPMKFLDDHSIAIYG